MRDRPDRSILWRTSKFPKILIAGIEDTLVPIQTAREMSITGQNCHFYELPQTAHMGFFEAKKLSENAVREYASHVFFNN